MMKTVCVDLDGVLARCEGTGDSTEIGPPIPGAKEFMAALYRDHSLVVFTCRSWQADEVVRWLRKHGIMFDKVHLGPGKPIAAAYVDDRAVECRPQAGGLESYNRARERIALLGADWSSKVEGKLTPKKARSVAWGPY